MLREQSPHPRNNLPYDIVGRYHRHDSIHLLKIKFLTTDLSVLIQKGFYNLDLQRPANISLKTRTGKLLIGVKSRFF